MYLLKPVALSVSEPVRVYSHSTMYLLKPDTFEETHSGNIFTFHHVSIKTSTIKKQYFTMLSHPLFVDLASIIGLHILFLNSIFLFSIFFPLSTGGRFYNIYGRQFQIKKLALSSSLPQNSLFNHFSCLLLNIITESNS